MDQEQFQPKRAKTSNGELLSWNSTWHPRAEESVVVGTTRCFDIKPELRNVVVAVVRMFEQRNKVNIWLGSIFPETGCGGGPEFTSH